MKKLEVKSWDEIQDMDFPIEEPLIDGLLYKGTYLFVGSPKIGKSYFMMDVCHHIATGTPFWERKVKKGRTLYLAREDNYGRIKERMYKMFDVEFGVDIDFCKESECINEGLIEQMEMYLTDHPDTKLIVVDTLQMVRGKGSEQYNYGADYEIIGKVKAFTDKHNICVIMVHHTRKMEANDPFDMISGSTGLLGAVDGAFIMFKKKRADRTAKLFATGRDIEDIELSVERDPRTFIWSLVSVDTEKHIKPLDPFLIALNNFICVGGGKWEGTATELLEHLPKEVRPESANILSRKINVTKDELYKDFGIKVESKRTATCRSLLFERDEERIKSMGNEFHEISEATQLEIPFDIGEDPKDVS